jgi:lipoprotein-releasing system permease protein
VSIYELLIGIRYTRAKRRNHFISFISLISLLGITLGITVLITVMSVMNGFQNEIRSRILGVASHIEISGVDGNLPNWRQVAHEALKNPEIDAAAPFVSTQGLISFGQVVSGAAVRGVLPTMEEKVGDLGKMMVEGQLEDLFPDGFGMILGRDLARILGVFTGDKVVLMLPQGQVTRASMPRLKQFTITGIFAAGHPEYDSSLALIHLADAQALYGMKDGQASGVRLKLPDMFDAPQVARKLASTISTKVDIIDWSRRHMSYFRAVQIEKRMMSLILALIIAVAAFNIVSTLGDGGN